MVILRKILGIVWTYKRKLKISERYWKQRWYVYRYLSGFLKQIHVHKYTPKGIMTNFNQGADADFCTFAKTRVMCRIYFTMYISKKR